MCDIRVVIVYPFFMEFKIMNYSRANSALYLNQINSPPDTRSDRQCTVEVQKMAKLTSHAPSPGACPRQSSRQMIVLINMLNVNFFYAHGGLFYFYQYIFIALNGSLQSCWGIYRILLNSLYCIVLLCECSLCKL